MKSSKLLTTELRAPYPLKCGLPLVPRMVFLASLSLYVASAPVAADQEVNIPDNLDIEFRCGDNTGESCPLDPNFNEIPFGNDKYLQFEAIADDEICYSGFEYTPFVNDTLAGIGVGCDSNPGDTSGMEAAEALQIIVNEAESGSDSTYMEGIYLDGLENSYDGEGTCLPLTDGTVVVQLAGGGADTFPWTADDTLFTGDGTFCDANSPHAIFVDFGGPRDIASLQVNVASSGGGGGVYAAGIELPDVSPDNCEGVGEDNQDCAIELVESPLPGQDLRTLITDETLVGNVDVLDGFPVRVVDPDPSCQALPTGEPQQLVFDTAQIYTYYPPGSVGPGDAVTGTLPLLVSDAGPTEYFTLSAKGCGTPRMMFNGPAVARGTPGSMAYMDIIAIESDIDPVDSLITFESDNESPYECKPGPVPGPLPVGAALDQPLTEINSRDNEVKQLKGNPGVVDNLSRDKTQPCGSRRTRSSRYSFVAYSLIHNEKTDMRSEIDDEIKVLEDTLARTRDCVSSSFYNTNLVAYPRYIRRYFDIAVGRAETCNAPLAGVYFNFTALFVDRFNSRLEQQGSAGFSSCYASGPNLDTIIETTSPGPGDKPLNAYGDILSQVQHLSYAIKTFVNELSKNPEDCSNPPT